MPAEPTGATDPVTPGQPSRTTRRGRLTRWGIGVTIAGVLVGGGIAMAAQSSPSPSPAAQSTTSESNALLSASGVTPSRTAMATRVRRLRGMYGSFTFRTKSGDETLGYERGTIESVASSNIVVRAADGTRMTWLLADDTVVRERGRVSTSALSSGQLVFVGGPITGGTAPGTAAGTAAGARDARLIIVRTGRPGTATSAN